MAISTLHNDSPFHVGDTVRVHYRIIEKDMVAGKTKKEKKEEVKDRIQVFEGICMAISGRAENKTFRVRRIGSGNIGIERIFPLVSPWIKKVEVKRKGDVRRAKLYYLRDKTAKEIARISSAQTLVATESAKNTGKAAKAVEATPAPVAAETQATSVKE